MDTIKLYLRFVVLALRSQTEYRASFFMMAAGQLLISFIEFLGIWALFHRFDILNGWTLPEAALFYGIINTAFAITEGFGRGFDTFPSSVKGGEFDRVLLRPRGTVFQVAVREIQVLRIGRFLQGAVILLWALAALHITAPGKILLILFAISGGVAVFYALFVFAAAISFWTVESLELMNTLTYGGTEAASFPISIYKPWFRKLFVFFVPLGCATYFPALALLGRPDTAFHSPHWFQHAAPAVGYIFFGLSICFWKFGVSKYRSTGS